MERSSFSQFTKFREMVILTLRLSKKFRATDLNLIIPMISKIGLNKIIIISKIIWTKFIGADTLTQN